MWVSVKQNWRRRRRRWQFLPPSTTLPDGDTKELEKIKNLELDARVRRLLRQGNKAGAVATLEQDYDVAQLTKQVEIAEAFIAEVKARKAAL